MKNISNSTHVYKDSNGCDVCKVPFTHRYKSDNICVGCHARKKLAHNLPRTPEQAARLGQVYYYPSKRCTMGGHFVKRLVNGSPGRCYTCRPLSDNVGGRPVDTDRIDRTCPDMIINRRDALTLGLKVYNTGKPCKNDHKSWRYVKTGSCIECDKQKS
jgi:hypothetical protein